MRISILILEKIHKELGSFEIGDSFDGTESLNLRFGYWKQIDLEKLNELLNVHTNYVAFENLLDIDEDTGEAWYYTLKLPPWEERKN